jgi:hypothetical protein
MSEPVARRRFFATSGLGVAAAIAAPDAAGALAATTSPRETLKLLIDGNRRWVTGKMTHPHQSVARRVALRHMQHPFATVFSCIDSRASGARVRSRDRRPGGDPYRRSARRRS